MSFFGTVWLVLAKDLRVELRTKEILFSTVLFALLIVLLAAFAFDLNALPSRVAAGGVLWITIAFAGILALSRTFLREREFGVWRALLMTPVSRSALYVGKLLGVLVFLLIVELILVPLLELFFHAPMLRHAGALGLILVLGTFGYAAIGTFFAAMTIRTRLRDLLLGVILYPLISPILICAVKATGAVLVGDGLGGAAFYLKLLVFIDLVYFIGGLWLFGFVMEE